MTVDIPIEVVDEIEEKKDWERVAWRRHSRMARDIAREREVTAEEGSIDYLVVKATVGQSAVGGGHPSGLGWRGKEEVCSSDV